VFTMLAFLCAVAMYFLPAIIAHQRWQRSQCQIPFARDDCVESLAHSVRLDVRDESRKKFSVTRDRLSILPPENRVGGK